MNNRTKILLFRWLLRINWLPSLLFMYPLAMLRKRLQARHVFFFDRYVLGGAQRVHLDILESISEEPKVVFFTRFSPNTVLKSAFESMPNTRCEDIHFWCDNLFFRLFAVHYWAFFLNRHNNLVVFSSNSTFFYDLLPWLRLDFCRIELLHNFTYGKKGMEAFGLANYQFLDKRLTVDAFTAQNIREQYHEHQVPEQFSDRILTIEPGVFVPDKMPKKDDAPLMVFYAGRSGVQKRTWLIDRIAAHCYQNSLPVVFHFAGDAEGDLSDFVKKNSILHGQVSDQKIMRNLYSLAHVVILTSAFEGFPMVIKEGMANGCVPLVTALPGNLTHLRNQENALLIQEIVNEDLVVKEGIAQLKWLIQNQEQRKGLSVRAQTYAREHFSRKIFLEKYRALFSEV
ncbi:MAG: glycosyltransferase family 4 protein [Chitinophagaceae bacterium]